MKADLKPLYSRLGYVFKSEDLLIRALSHRSVGKNNNERLEFLGDSVLGYVIAEVLFINFPDDNEGKLSRYRSILVRGETLAEIAMQFKIGDYLYLGGGELKSGGFRRASILSDALEAIIGAIVLDSDINTAKNCIHMWYKDRIATVNQEILKDPKSRLQEYLQAKKLDLPEYKIELVEGKEHQQTFHIKCEIKSLDIYAMASGNSRRNAEQQAAVNALEMIKNG
ncbi:MAG: ribonuclease III [Pseudomonadota bacterium]